MNKKFSKEFLNEVGELLQICLENNTDNIDIRMEVNGKILKISFSFSVEE